MFAEMCRSYFPTSFICILRLLKQQIDPARPTIYIPSMHTLIANAVCAAGG